MEVNVNNLTFSHVLLPAGRKGSSTEGKFAVYGAVFVCVSIFQKYFT